MTIVIEQADESDLPALLNLLADSGLPQAGISDHLATALVARIGQDVIGSAALEVYGGLALLRSVAVKQAYQGQGLGQRLTQAALNLARQQGITHVYLLTETASRFFPRFGFRPIERSHAPVAVQQSIEFTSACPDSALAMEVNLEHVTK